MELIHWTVPAVPLALNTESSKSPATVWLQRSISTITAEMFKPRRNWRLIFSQSMQNIRSTYSPQRHIHPLQSVRPICEPWESLRFLNGNQVAPQLTLGLRRPPFLAEERVLTFEKSPFP